LEGGCHACKENAIVATTMTANDDAATECLAPDIIDPDDVGSYIKVTLKEVKRFYERNTQIKESHGHSHVMAVFGHAQAAIACCSPALSTMDSMEVSVAALLHDVDDDKYFPDSTSYLNANTIMESVGIPLESHNRILAMIGMVSCSKNGNSVPPFITETGRYHWLIPRWSDRLEAVGKIGVVRCYQYSKEKGRPLTSDKSPRATTLEQVWKYATPERFNAYQARGGSSEDMISHYYDKLLHVACPPKDIVRNRYLEEKADESAKPLIELCLRFGRTGVVDEEYILGLCESTAR